MKIYLSIILLAAAAYLNYLNDYPVRINSESKDQVSDSLIVVTISAVGDLMCHSVQYNYARITPDSFDFRPVYREVKSYLQQSDLTLGNLETVTAGKSKGYSGYPFFNSPDEYIAALKYAGFDLITTSNNHSLDKGETGLLRTIEQLNLNHIHYNGTFISQRDRDSIRIFDIKGIKIAFLAYTYGTNGVPVPKGKNYLVNLIDPELIRKDINAARYGGADLVVLHYHFGEEYKREPDNFQKRIVELSIEAGADIIIGGHPHVLQPIEFFSSKRTDLDSGVVAYSLGNFISNQQWRYSDAGVILNLIIVKNKHTNNLRIDEVSYLPTWVYKGYINKKQEYLILPSELYYNQHALPFLTDGKRELMKQAFEDSKMILNKYDPRPVLKSIKKHDEAILTE